MKAVSRLQWSLIAAIGATIALVIYFSGYALFARFDYPYLEHFYHFSQWQVPQSNRVMSDNELYQVAGVKLAEGADPFSINPEAPPFGKYLYGWSVALFGGPYWVSLLMYLGLGVVFYALLKEISDHRTANLAAVLVLLSSPILMDQVSRTMLDLPSAITLTVHVWCMVRLLKHKQDLFSKQFSAWWELIGAAVSLGLFAACKIPFFVPVVLLGDFLFMWRRQFKAFAVMVVLTGLTYLGVYTPYFFQGHSLREWLGAQKWMVNFYLSGGSPFVWFSNLVTITTGWYKDWWGAATWHWTTYWSPVWLFGLLALLAGSVKAGWHKYRYVAVLGLLLIFGQAFQPFWPRYFLVVLPLAIICLVPLINSLIQRRKWWLLTIAGLFIAAYGIWFFRPSPEGFVGYFNEDANQGDYLEVYNYLVPPNFDRQSFNTNMRLIDSALGSNTRQVTLSYEPVHIWQDQTQGTLEQTWSTPIGDVSYQRPVTLVRYHNQWRLAWDWHAGLAQYEPGADVQVIAQPVTAGRLLTNDNQVLSAGGSTKWVWVDMTKIQDLETTVDAAAKLTSQGGTEVRKLLVVNALPNQMLKIEKLADGLSPDEQQQYSQIPGIVISEVPTNDRVYHPAIGAANKQELIELIESYHPELQSQASGQILVTNNGQEPVVIKTVPAMPGQDVRLLVSMADLLSL